MGRHCKTCCGGVVRGNGRTANATLGGDIGAWCTLWIIIFMAKIMSWVGTRCYQSTKCTCKGHWGGKGMPEFHGRHWMLPLNIDCHEGTILMRCWTFVKVA